MRSGMTEEVVALQVEREPLAEPSHVKDPVTPPFEPLHAVVDAVHKPARLPPLEVVGALIYPPLAPPQNALELSQPAGPHPLTPGPHRTRGPRLCIVTREQLGQVFPPVVGRLHRGRGGEHPLPQLPLRRLELRRSFAKRPHRSCDCVVVGVSVQSGQRYRLGRISIQTGTSNSGRWRRRTTASHPCRSRISRPQRRPRVPSRGLSTRMSQCPCAVLWVERTRTSGTFSGTCMRSSLATPPVHLGRDHRPTVLPRSIIPVAHHGSSGRTPNISARCGVRLG